jgi:uncharacterized protein with PQ loop repeat
MKTLKSYQDFTNEEIDWKKGIVTTALGASLAMSTPSLAKGDDVINKIETVSNKAKNSDDEVLNNILSEIRSNIKSTDSTKYIELFNKLSSHLSKEYGYEIKAREIPKIDESSDLTMIEIIGWLGSICLAICGLPQAWMSYRDKHSHGISWAFVLLWAFGEAFALAYVYDKLDLPLVTNYLTNILILGVILYYKINPGVEKTGSEKRIGH